MRRVRGVWLHEVPLQQAHKLRSKINSTGGAFAGAQREHGREREQHGQRADQEAR